MVGITSYGAYVPAHSLGRDIIAQAWDFPKAPGGKAVAGVDEDSVTMAVEAGLDCLNGIDEKTIDGLFFATTTAPYKEKQGSSLIAAALDLRKDITTADFTDSLKGGTTAMRAAFDAIKSGSARSILVTASDCRLPEPETMYEYQFGDGAAAVLLGKEDVAAKIGFDRKQIQDSMFMTIGNTGTPLCLMMLVSALEKSKNGDKLLLVGYGNGSDAFYLKVAQENENVRKNIRGIKGHTKKMRKIESYGKYLKFRKLLERDRPPPYSSTVTCWRDRDAEVPLYGGKCTNKSNTISVHTMMPMYQPGYEFLGFPATQDGSKVAYAEAGVKDPKKEIGFAEVHDCFMISELLHYQDLGFCGKGEGASYLKEGAFNVDGKLPVNPFGG